MPYVKPKKHLGQHFLKDKQIAQNIVNALCSADSALPLLEIGPGTGVLTSLLLTQLVVPFKVIEIDQESIIYLHEELNLPFEQIIQGDFLKTDTSIYFEEQFNIIGNFPYNISSQIFFKILENRQLVNRVTCMIQKEVADRIATQKGGRTAGILTILIQAFYDVTHEYDVPPSVFIPPPKVVSSVITLQRNKNAQLNCDEKLFFKVVKQAFAMRRKTLRNNLKLYKLPNDITNAPLFSRRAETLSVNEFVNLTKLIEKYRMD